MLMKLITGVDHNVTNMCYRCNLYGHKSRVTTISETQNLSLNYAESSFSTKKKEIRRF